MAGEPNDGVTRGLLRHKPTNTTYHVEIEREVDGRWLAEITDLPGVMAYGASKEDAMRHALSLALRVLAESVENGELGSSTEPFSVAYSS